MPLHVHEQMLNWAERLATLARGVLAESLSRARMNEPTALPGDIGLLLAREFRDEMGHARPIARWVILHACAARPEVAATLGTEQGASVHSAASPSSADDRLWSALLTRPLGDFSEQVRDCLRTDALLAGDAVALLPGPAIRQASLESGNPIEVWTETELAGLHALWWHARGEPTGTLMRVVDAAVEWHLEHTQPDNATNHPWAAHVFLLDWVKHRREESRLFAETLVHNCQVTFGRPDQLSAWILLDCAHGMAASDGSSD